MQFFYMLLLSLHLGPRLRQICCVAFFLCISLQCISFLTHRIIVTMYIHKYVYIRYNKGRRIPHTVIWMSSAGESHTHTENYRKSPSNARRQHFGIIVFMLSRGHCCIHRKKTQMAGDNKKNRNFILWQTRNGFCDGVDVRGPWFRWPRARQEQKKNEIMPVCRLCVYMCNMHRPIWNRYCSHPVGDWNPSVNWLRKWSLTFSIPFLPHTFWMYFFFICYNAVRPHERFWCLLLTRAHLTKIFIRILYNTGKKKNLFIVMLSRKIVQSHAIRHNDSRIHILDARC